MKNHPNAVPYCFAETSVNQQDITCVHAALKEVDAETLLCVLLESHLSWSVDPRLLTGAAKRHLMKKTTSMLSLMYDIEPVPLTQPNRVIIPVQTFEYPGTGSSLIRRISAAILDVSEQEVTASTLDYASAITASVTNEAALPWTNKVESVDSFISAPWSEVLGYAIWLPSTLTAYERTAELAHLFWVMAFSGFAEAVNEIRVVNLKRHGGASHIPEPVALCFEEYEQKMNNIAALMRYNGMVDANNVSRLLAQVLVA